MALKEIDEGVIPAFLKICRLLGALTGYAATLDCSAWFSYRFASLRGVWHSNGRA
jgi:hypothetical protein